MRITRMRRTRKEGKLQSCRIVCCTTRRAAAEADHRPHRHCLAGNEKKVKRERKEIQEMKKEKRIQVKREKKEKKERQRKERKVCGALMIDWKKKEWRRRKEMTKKREQKEKEEKIMRKQRKEQQCMTARRRCSAKEWILLKREQKAMERKTGNARKLQLLLVSIVAHTSRAPAPRLPLTSRHHRNESRQSMN